MFVVAPMLADEKKSNKIKAYLSHASCSVIAGMLINDMPKWP